MTPEMWTFLKDLTLGGWAVIALILGARKAWYFGHVYDALEKRLDKKEAECARYLNMLLLVDQQADEALAAGEQLADRNRFSRKRAL